MWNSYQAADHLRQNLGKLFLPLDCRVVIFREEDGLNSHIGVAFVDDCVVSGNKQWAFFVLEVW